MSYAVCAEIHMNKGYIDLDQLEQKYTHREIIQGIKLWLKEQSEIDQLKAEVKRNDAS